MFNPVALFFTLPLTLLSAFTPAVVHANGEVIDFEACAKQRSKVAAFHIWKASVTELRSVKAASAKKASA